MDDILYWFNLGKWPLIIVIIIIAIILSRRRFSSVKRVFEAQALKRNGSVTGRFMSYTLTFAYHDHNLIVSEYPGSRYQSAYTRVVTNVKKMVEHSMKISSESWASEIGKKLGMQDVQIGSSEFDEKFMIKGSDEYFVINVLTYNVQDKLLALRKYRPVVTIENNRLKVNVPRVLKTEEAYDHLIEAALVIIDRLNEV